MSDLHDLSKRVYAMEAENRILREVLDSVFNRDVMTITEKNHVADILHKDATLTVRSIAKSLVRLYGTKVKSPSDPDSPKRDVSRTQAVRNVERLLEEGMDCSRLRASVLAAQKYYDLSNAGWAYRPNCGNFFGMKKVYIEFLPEQAEVVPDEGKAAEIAGLF